MGDRFFIGFNLNGIIYDYEYEDAAGDYFHNKKEFADKLIKGFAEYLSRTLLSKIEVKHGR